MSDERNNPLAPFNHPNAFGLERVKNWNGRNCVGCGQFRKGIRPVGSLCDPCGMVRYWPRHRPRMKGRYSAWYGWDDNGEWIWRTSRFAISVPSFNEGCTLCGERDWRYCSCRWRRP